MQRIATIFLLIVMSLNSVLPVYPFGAGPVILANAPQAPALQEEPTPTATDDSLPGSPTPEETETTPEETVLPTETETPVPGETPTEPPTETPTETPTVTPTESPTPELTITPTPTETATPTPTAMPTPTLTLQAEPTWLRAGERITISWAIGGVTEIDPAAGWRLVLQLPKGVIPVGAHEGSFDPTTSTYQTAIAGTAGSIECMPGQILLDTPEIQARIMEGEEIVAETRLALEVLPSVRVDKNGGEVTGLNDKVKVKFPASAISEEIDLTIQPARDLGRFAYLLAGEAFEIVALKAGKTDKVHQFADKFSIEVHYSDQAVFGDESSLTLFYYDETELTWIPLPSRVDEANNRLTAQSDHLTYFAFDTQNFQEAQLPSILGFEASPFTGAATYSFPIEVPEGPGGFQPEVVLTYNSQVVDEATAGSQASWVGMGWSLEVGKIERNMHGTIDEERDDTLSMTVGTYSTMLIPGTDGYYHPETDTFWRIQYDSTADTWKAWDKQGVIYTFAERARYPHIERGCYQYDVTWAWALTSIQKPGITNPITITYYKEAKTNPFVACNGSYGFTKAIYPERITYPNGKYSIVFEKSFRQDYDSAWWREYSLVFYQDRKLDRIRILHGSQTVRTYEFTYTTDANAVIYPNLVWSAGGWTLTLSQITEKGLNESSSLPAMTFSYGDDMHLTSATNGYGGKVDYAYDIVPWHEASAGKNASFIDDIGTYESGACDNFYPDYSEPDPETGVPPHWKPVPDDTGGWGAVTGDVHCGNKYLVIGTNSEASKALARRFIRPGGYYGVAADLAGSGTQLGLVSGTWSQYSPATPTNGSISTQWMRLPANLATFNMYARVKCSSCEMNLYELRMAMTHYRVTTRTFTDLVTGQAPFVFTYSYGTPKTNDSAPQGAVWYYDEYSLFLGHAWVKVVDPYNQVTTTYYHQEIDLKGLPSRSRVTKSTEGGNILSEVFYEYFQETLSFNRKATNSTFPTNAIGAQFTDLEIYWPHVQRVKTRTFDGTTSIGTTAITEDAVVPVPWNGTLVEYAYNDPYGNVRSEEHSYWNGNRWKDLRVRWINYATYVDASIYLVGFPAADDWLACRADDYDGGCIDQSLTSFPSYLDVISSTWFLYDNKPVSPRFTISAGVLTGMRTYLETEGSTHYYRDETYTVDSWGNRTKVTTFTQPGTYTSLATNERLETNISYEDTLHPGYHTYPESMTDPEGLGTTWDYDYALGVPTKETDPNNIATTAAYDSFGRLVKLCKYGDACDTKPTVAVTYTDATPFKIEITQKVTDAIDYKLRKYYNGFGNLIQDQTLGVPLTTGVKDIKVDTKYNLNGQVIEQTVPYEVNPATNTGFVQDFSGNKKAVTTYDAFGRVTQALQPDTTATTMAYAMVNSASSGLGEPVLRTTVKDALNHSVENYTNVYGQLRKVNQAGLTVTYQYYPTGLLHLVTQPGNHTTTIVYDKAGRKTSIDDPDMGIWRYTYDALGNLITQTDANDPPKLIWMKYDGIGRLLEKRAGGSGGTLITSNVYDLGTNGKGHRTSMVDASGLTTSWTYDQRGRVKSETRSFPRSLGTYTLSFLYNSADLVSQITYPDGEIVTVAYDARQLPTTLSSSLAGVSVTNASFDAIGRLRGVSLGSNIQPSYDYYDFNEAVLPGHTGRLQAITVGDLLKLTYKYDAVGNPTEIKDESRDVGPQTITFTYDALNRLNLATATGGQIPGYQHDYNYSASTGEITSVIKGGATTTYTYGEAGHPHAVTGLTDGSAYHYDANGNMDTRTEDGITYDQTWTIENRLEQVKWPQGTTPDNTTTFVYDGDGNRVVKVEKYKDAFGIVRETTTVYVGGLYEVTFITTGQENGQFFANAQP